MSFDVASAYSRSVFEMCVVEVATDGTVGATLVAWNSYGTCTDIWEPHMAISYTPVTIAVETTATRFKVSVRHTGGSAYNDDAGVVIFRATGVAS